MLTAGIVAEFDPFHNGHKYLIDQARKGGATHIAVAMSGSAVQRGRPAFMDKYFRARCAVENGADLVLELPAPYSCSNAEVFARAGVTALAALGEGAVQRQVFGSETEDTELILRAAEASEALKDSDEVKKFLSEGMSYPLAMCQACELEYGADVAEVLRNPNSTLATEYCKALKTDAPWIVPCAVKRVGAGHNSSDIDGNTASASLVRERIFYGDEVSDLLPYAIGQACNDICLDSKIDPIILYHLLSADKQSLMSLPDVNEALANKILKAVQDPCASAAELLSRCKSKDITAARLSRLALHLVLGVRKEDIAPLPYVRILAFNERGREILSAGEHTLPIDTSLAKLEKTSAQAERVSLIERRASHLRGIGTVSDMSANEYRISIKMTKNT